MRKVTIPLAAVFAALALTGCAGGFAITGQSSAKKVGSKCYLKIGPDQYIAGHYRQTSEGEITCIRDEGGS